MPVLVITHGKRSRSWATFSKRIRMERGSRCEKCGRACERVFCHHVLEYAIFPQFRVEPGNILVFCDRCHSDATSSERTPQEQALFYSRLPGAARERTGVFLRLHAGRHQMLLYALASGPDYWPPGYP